jgi:hypothetical protein
MLRRIGGDVLDAELGERRRPASDAAGPPAAGLGRVELMPATVGVKRTEVPLAAIVSARPRKLDAVPSSSIRKAEASSLVASSTVATRSIWRPSPGSQRCREPSWCSSMPAIGRRGRRRRCAPRRGAGRTSPARRTIEKTGHFARYLNQTDHTLPTAILTRSTSSWTMRACSAGKSPSQSESSCRSARRTSVSVMQSPCSRAPRISGASR